ncbi:hypothetical protein J3R30DRAFT_3422273 [Lentinula aciculospora]|uniref:Meiotically up-regulated gene 152 protein n=1 Tax=Lentinula aciculospora TaxID=153920 RepID=A0A9W9DXF3_9AGAR|nr:hypothetical protein J3R30DRAFT_3422273 [Lentinula aciculospora]
MTTVASAAVTLTQDSTSSPLPKFKAPSVETFSFKAPLLPASSTAVGSSKQRRVSLALPSSPRVVPTSAWTFRDDTGLEEKKGKLRKIATDGEEELHERKLRKKWTQEETQMLVDGCNKHGVGNWKTILSDSTLKFDNRSPVDLKDRFRTYFPDAYKQHYPNARTHLSTKIRSTLPDGSSLFEKTRSKKRRPFTEEEDRALKAGYEKHGTIWATIVKDPVFQEQNRRSTDLRDRFRNAFPELYQAAGYKPRTAVKKKAIVTASSSTAATTASTPIFTSRPSTPATSPRKQPIRAATDDPLAMFTTGPVRMQTRRRRRNTSQGLFRGGTKSVPQSNAPSEDEMSSGEEDDDEVLKPMRVTRSVSNSLSSSNVFGWGHKPSPSSFSSFSSSPVTSSTTATDDEVDNVVEVSDIMDTSLEEYSYDFVAPQNSNGSNVGMTMMIGKSAWGTQDWFSPNPRLDNSNDNANSGIVSSSSTFIERGGGNLSPSSPFSTFSSPPSFSLQTLNALNSDLLNPMSSHFSLAGNNDSSERNEHGVFDRYDLVPPSASNPYHSHTHANSFSSSSSYTPYENISFSSDIGLGDDYESRSAFSDEWASAGVGGGAMSSSMSMDGGMGTCAPSGRGFTHHSDYAGDLIFSARTHQPVQPFAQQGLGLGLSGMGAPEISQSSGIHPLQLHTHTPALSALPGIDEIELTGITLEDSMMAESSPDLDIGIMDMSSSPPSASDTQQDMRQAHHHQQQQPSNATIRRRNIQPRSQSVMSESRHLRPLAFEDLVDLGLPDDDEEDVEGKNDLLHLPESDHDNLDYPSDDDEQHLTPPATPITRRRPLRRLRKTSRRAGDQNSSSSAHGRSVSVPPVDRMGLESPDLLQMPHANSQPEMNRLSSSSLNYQYEPPTSMSSTDQSASPLQQSTASPIGDLSTPAAAAQIPLPNPPTFASLFLATQSENLYNLPFLDLHYYGGNLSGGMNVNGGGIMSTMPDSSDTGSSRQALDLAQSTRSTSSLTGNAFTLAGRRMVPDGVRGGKSVIQDTSNVTKSEVGTNGVLAHSHPSPPPMRSHSLSHSHAPSHQGLKSRRSSHFGHHQRGQSTANVMSASSSVCPQDLVLRSDNSSERSETNKRKRASWDGANM